MAYTDKELLRASQIAYNAFANKFNRSNKISDYFTYDKDNKTVWIMWYEEEMI